MRNLTIAAAALALLGSVGPALATDKIEGMVESVNSVAGTLVLKNGEQFVFRDGWVLRGIFPGQLVGVTYSDPGVGIGAFTPDRHHGDPTAAF